jgi:hypothetical protein
MLSAPCLLYPLKGDIGWCGNNVSLPGGRDRTESDFFQCDFFRKKLSRIRTVFFCWCPGEDSNLHASRR